MSLIFGDCKLEQQAKMESLFLIFCLDNKIIAIGWSLHDDTLSEISISEEEIVKLKSERDNISNFEDYSLVYKKFYKENVNTQIYKLYNEIKINDLIWMRHNGEYYLGRVGENSKCNIALIMNL